MSHLDNFHSQALKGIVFCQLICWRHDTTGYRPFPFQQKMLKNNWKPTKLTGVKTNKAEAVLAEL